MFTVIETIRNRVYAGHFDEEYAEFIMNNCAGDRVICNGDTLIEAMESLYLVDEFIAHLESIE